LKFLYEHGVRPAILCGTSVGSLNASKLAEGDGAIAELEQLWRQIDGNGSIYEPSPAFRQLTNKEPDLAAEIIGTVAGLGLGCPSVGSVALSHLLYDGITAVSDLALESALFDLDPLRKNIVKPKLNPTK